MLLGLEWRRYCACFSSCCLMAFSISRGPCANQCYIYNHWMEVPQKQAYPHGCLGSLLWMASFQGLLQDWNFLQKWEFEILEGGFIIVFKYIKHSSQKRFFIISHPKNVTRNWRNCWFCWGIKNVLTLRNINSGMTESRDLIQNSQQINRADTLPRPHTCRRNPSERGYLRNNSIGNVKTLGNFNKQWSIYYSSQEI